MEPEEVTQMANLCRESAERCFALVRSEKEGFLSTVYFQYPLLRPVIEGVGLYEKVMSGFQRHTSRQGLCRQDSHDYHACLEQLNAKGLSDTLQDLVSNNRFSEAAIAIECYSDPLVRGLGYSLAAEIAEETVKDMPD